jgi:hypothetical protein
MKKRMNIENPAQLRFKKYIISEVDFSLQGRSFDIWVKYDDIYTSITAQAFESHEKAVEFFQTELTTDRYTEVAFNPPYHPIMDVVELAHITSFEGEDTPLDYLKISILLLENE